NRNNCRVVARSLGANVPTIAVVDDDGDILSLVKEILVIEGYDVLLYDDGHMALDALGINPPDLIISDIRMLHMDGIELLRRVRQKSRRRSAVVSFCRSVGILLLNMVSRSPASRSMG